ncbi:polyphenol oxidase family protein [Actinomyces radicidentis]|uniref:polyphenol oxidase family protein n=1 Tax=Actinomyces radicidentis TaxID=111015 RepID=UPI0028E9EC3D|nr:polyphenol oxidase family protein [Actinomyces radicidentis]
MRTSTTRDDLLIEVDLGPRARGYFTTRGTGAPSVPETSDNAGEGDYAGLNLAAHVGDDPARVAASRRLLEEALGLEPGGIAWMNQVHSANVARAVPGDVPTADALLLDLRGDDGAHPQAAAVLVADCVPLLLASDDGAVVSAVHAGRRGMLDGVVEAALGAMVEAGVEPASVHAAIGPCVCGRCYEVPAAMRDDAGLVEPASASTTSWGTPALDVAAGVLAQLERSGVTSISRVGVGAHAGEGPWCTLEDERFYSYRRDGVTGRIAGVVVAARADRRA